MSDAQVLIGMAIPWTAGTSGKIRGGLATLNISDEESWSSGLSHEKLEAYEKPSPAKFAGKIVLVNSAEMTFSEKPRKVRRYTDKELKDLKNPGFCPDFAYPNNPPLGQFDPHRYYCYWSQTPGWLFQGYYD